MATSSQETPAPRTEFRPFDEQLWTVLIALAVLGGFVLGTILAYLRFDDPRWYANAFTWCLAVVLVFGAAAAALVLVESRRFRRTMQLAILLSLLFHVILLVTSLETHIFQRFFDREVAARQQPDQAVLPPDHLRVPDYVPVEQRALTRRALDRPVPTETPQPPPEPARRERTEPQPAPPVVIPSPPAETEPPSQPDRAPGGAPSLVRRPQGEDSVPRYSEQTSRLSRRLTGTRPGPAGYQASAPPVPTAPARTEDVRAVDSSVRRQPTSSQVQPRWDEREPSTTTEHDRLQITRREADQSPAVAVSSQPTAKRAPTQPAAVPRTAADLAEQPAVSQRTLSEQLNPRTTLAQRQATTSPNRAMRSAEPTPDVTVPSPETAQRRESPVATLPTVAQSPAPAPVLRPRETPRPDVASAAAKLPPAETSRPAQPEPTPVAAEPPRRTTGGTPLVRAAPEPASATPSPQSPAATRTPRAEAVPNLTQVPLTAPPRQPTSAATAPVAADAQATGLRVAAGDAPAAQPLAARSTAAARQPAAATAMTQAPTAPSAPADSAGAAPAPLERREATSSPPAVAAAAVGTPRRQAPTAEVRTPADAQATELRVAAGGTAEAQPLAARSTAAARQLAPATSAAQAATAPSPPAAAVTAPVGGLEGMARAARAPSAPADAQAAAPAATPGRQAPTAAVQTPADAQATEVHVAAGGSAEAQPLAARSTAAARQPAAATSAAQAAAAPSPPTPPVAAPVAGPEGVARAATASSPPADAQAAAPAATPRRQAPTAAVQTPADAQATEVRVAAGGTAEAQPLAARSTAAARQPAAATVAQAATAPSPPTTAVAAPVAGPEGVARAATASSPPADAQAAAPAATPRRQAPTAAVQTPADAQATEVRVASAAGAAAAQPLTARSTAAARQETAGTAAANVRPQAVDSAPAQPPGSLASGTMTRLPRAPESPTVAQGPAASLARRQSAAVLPGIETAATELAANVGVEPARTDQPRPSTATVARQATRDALGARSQQSLETPASSTTTLVGRPDARRIAHADRPTLTAEPMAPGAPARAASKADIAASPVNVESPALAVAPRGSGEPAAAPARMALAKALTGVAGAGQGRNLDRAQPAPDSPAVLASAAARRRTPVQATPPGPEPVPSASPLIRHLRAGGDVPGASLAVDVPVSAPTAAGANRPAELAASAAAALTRAAAQSPAGPITAARGTTDIDLGPTQLVSEGGLSRGSGGGQPVLNPATDAPQIARSTRVGGGPLAALAADTHAQVPLAPPGQAGGPMPTPETTAAPTAVVRADTGGVQPVSGGPARATEVGPPTEISMTPQIGPVALRRAELAEAAPGEPASGGGDPDDEEEKKRLRLARAASRVALADAPTTAEVLTPAATPAAGTEPATLAANTAVAKAAGAPASSRTAPAAALAGPETASQPVATAPAVRSTVASDAPPSPAPTAVAGTAPGRTTRPAPGPMIAENIQTPALAAASGEPGQPAAAASATAVARAPAAAGRAVEGEPAASQPGEATATPVSTPGIARAAASRDAPSSPALAAAPAAGPGRTARTAPGPMTAESIQTPALAGASGEPSQPAAAASATAVARAATAAGRAVEGEPSAASQPGESAAAPTVSTPGAARAAALRDAPANPDLAAVPAAAPGRAARTAPGPMTAESIQTPALAGVSGEPSQPAAAASATAVARAATAAGRAVEGEPSAASQPGESAAAPTVSTPGVARAAASHDAPSSPALAAAPAAAPGRAVRTAPGPMTAESIQTPALAAASGDPSQPAAAASATAVARAATAAGRAVEGEPSAANQPGEAAATPTVSTPGVARAGVSRDAPSSSALATAPAAGPGRTVRAAAGPMTAENVRTPAVAATPSEPGEPAVSASATGIARAAGGSSGGMAAAPTVVGPSGDALTVQPVAAPRAASPTATPAGPAVAGSPTGGPGRAALAATIPTAASAATPPGGGRGDQAPTEGMAAGDTAVARVDATGSAIGNDHPATAGSPEEAVPTVPAAVEHYARAEAAAGDVGPVRIGGGTGSPARAARGPAFAAPAQADVVQLAGTADSGGEETGSRIAAQGVVPARLTGGAESLPTFGLVGGLPADESLDVPAAIGPGSGMQPRTASTPRDDGPALASAEHRGGPLRRASRVLLPSGDAAMTQAEMPVPGPSSIANDTGEEDRIGGPSSELAVSRQMTGSGLPVSIEPPDGPGGLGPQYTVSVGINNRRAASESVQVHPRPARLLRQQVGGRPDVVTSVVNPVEPFRRRGMRGPGDSGGRGGPLPPQTEDSVERGLVFLARQQQRDGSWSLQGLDDPPATLVADIAATGLALLAFQGAGYNHREHRYAPNVAAGIEFLLKNQKPNGDLYVPASDEVSNQSVWLYSHSIAALALCEAYGMTQDPRLREPVQKALDFIVQSQHKERGGWRYSPNYGSDMSVTGWMMMALKSGELANLEVPESTYSKIRHWLDVSQGSAQEPHLYRYNPFAPDTDEQRHGRSPTKTMTSVGLLMRLYLGWRRDNANMVKGAEYLARNLPALGTSDRPERDTYYWYYATQVMFHMGGNHWNRWNDRMHPLLVDSQIKKGPLAGSWDPRKPIPDRWAGHAGRLYVTTMNLLSLEVFYRHLPLYEDTAK